MATVAPVITARTATAPAKITWTGIVTGDTVTSFPLLEATALAGAVQFSGTYAGGTVASLKVSNDDSTYFSMKDQAGTTISGTAAAYFDFSTAGGWIKPSVISGAADSITVTVILRG